VSETVIFELSGFENGGVGPKMRILSPMVLKLSRKYQLLVSNWDASLNVNGFDRKKKGRAPNFLGDIWVLRYKNLRGDLSISTKVEF
jgi:hypothetical protein